MCQWNTHDIRLVLCTGALSASLGKSVFRRGSRKQEDAFHQELGFITAIHPAKILTYEYIHQQKIGVSSQEEPGLCLVFMEL